MLKVNDAKEDFRLGGTEGHRCVVRSEESGEGKMSEG